MAARRPAELRFATQGDGCPGQGAGTADMYMPAPVVAANVPPAVQVNTANTAVATRAGPAVVAAADVELSGGYSADFTTPGRTFQLAANGMEAIGKMVQPAVASGSAAPNSLWTPPGAGSGVPAGPIRHQPSSSVGSDMRCMSRGDGSALRESVLPGHTVNRNVHVHFPSLRSTHPQPRQLPIPQNTSHLAKLQFAQMTAGTGNGQVEPIVQKLQSVQQHSGMHGGMPPHVACSQGLMMLSADHRPQHQAEEPVSSSSGQDEELSEMESEGDEDATVDQGTGMRLNQVNLRERGRVRSINEHLDRLKVLLKLETLPAQSIPVTPCCTELKHSTCLKSQMSNGTASNVKKAKQQKVRKSITKVHILRAAYLRIRELQQQASAFDGPTSASRQSRASPVQSAM